MAEARAEVLTDLQETHGLEQQLLHALIECLSDAEEVTKIGRRHREILARQGPALLLNPFCGHADIYAGLDV
ncbi:MAG: hypothetical protein J2P48_12945 [Alphaproteobacteria bacterium]|nr:hypothetical protein [Alphaproteobacteria bacterium]